MNLKELDNIEELLKDSTLLRTVFNHAHKNYLSKASKVDKPEHFMVYCISQSLLAELLRQGYTLTKKE